MSITINPEREPGNGAPAPKKNVFGAVTNKAFTQDKNRTGVYAGANASEGLMPGIERVASGKWYKGPRELVNVMESFTMAISGDRLYDSISGASFGFIGHLARRLPAPILFDDPMIAKFIFGENKPTAAVDTSGRMWMEAGFFEECLQEEARDKTMVLPLMLHEYLHIALNHTKRLHNFPADISNIAKDKVINPMAGKMFDAETQKHFSDIFKLGHGNRPEDKKYEGLSEETIAKMLLQERRDMLENKGTIRIKNLIIEDGTVTKITKLSVGKGEIKEYDTVVVKVQDMGMMDRVDTEFDCATLEVDNIDNRLKVRRRPGSPGDQDPNQQDGPIQIPTQSDQPSQGQDQGQGQAQKDQNPGQGSDANDPGRKSLDDIRKDMQARQGGSAQSGQNDAQSGQNAQPGSQDSGAGQNGQSQGQQGGQDAQATGSQPGQSQGQGQDAGAAGSSQPGQGGQAAGGTQPQSGAGSAPGGQDASAGHQPGQGSQGGGQQPGRVDAAQQSGAGGSGQNKPAADPQGGAKIGDADANGVSGGSGQSGKVSGSPADILGQHVRNNPLDADRGHEVDLSGLNEWLKQNGYEELLGKMRSEEFDPEQVDRAIEIALKEADKERLLIGSGYAGAHVESYMHTVVRPNSVYKVNWLRRATEFLQGHGTDVTSSLDEYGIYTYIDPVDLGMPADDGVYYSGTVQQKPDGAFFVILDTSGSIWADKRRMGHLAAFALGIRSTQDDMSPDVWIVGADTVVSGVPQFYDEEKIVEAVETGIPLGGGGGTDYAMPINQTMAYCKEKDIKPLGILYLGDFEVRPPAREELPEDLPPMFFLGMPHDVVRAEAFVKSVSTWAEVHSIEDDITLDALAAEAKAEAHKGVGHNNLNP